MKKLLILGVNGFIGHHLSEAVMRETDWHVYGMDLESDRVAQLLDNRAFTTSRATSPSTASGSSTTSASATCCCRWWRSPHPPPTSPTRCGVFELDFEANLPLIRQCVKHHKRVVFPSTSEIYGMSTEPEFHPYESALVLGPIPKSRWIYSCSKQLLDRVIWAYGDHGLDFTLFRPFNWIGPGLDRMQTPKEGSSRVLTQFLGNIVRGEDIQLVDGGAQRRCFTYVSEGIDCLLKIIANKERCRLAAHLQHRQSRQRPLDPPAGRDDAGRRALDRRRTRPPLPRCGSSTCRREKYYGAGYQDVQSRVPWIKNTVEELGWKPDDRHAHRGAAHLRVLPGQSRRGPRAGRCGLIRLAMSGMASVPPAPDNPARRVALKIDVDTLRGTLEGVPRLVTALLQSVGAAGNVLLQRRTRPHRAGTETRVSARLPRQGAAHLGGGTLRLEDAAVRHAAAGPAISASAAAAVMRAVRDAGFEVGLHCYDHVRWQDGVARADASWTRARVRARRRSVQAGVRPPAAVACRGGLADQPACAGARVASTAFVYASDTRGSSPFMPVDGRRHGSLRAAADDTADLR